MSKMIFRGETGMTVSVVIWGPEDSHVSVQVRPDRSPVFMTMTAREWADLSRCAGMFSDEAALRDAKEIA